MLYSLQFNLFHTGIRAATTEETSVEMSKSINEFSTEKISEEQKQDIYKYF